ncbi:MAG: radical SAM protein [Candidatus Kuenenia sp.]|nr:radical SAM protein [Candidatus Kuenenia hertensis]
MDKNTAFDGFPFILGWELTLACNLRCGHCGSTAGTTRQHELTTKEALALCDQFPQMLVQEVDFTGGEPLLRQDWPLLAKRLHDYDITVKMVTNGMALNDEAISLMKETGVAGVGVSIDGLEVTHDSVRGRKGLFRSLMSSIEKTVKFGLPLTVITSVHALNLPELPEMMRQFLAVGVRNWRLQPIFPLGRARCGNLRMTENDFLDFGTFVTTWEPRARAQGMVMRTGDAYGYYTELDNSDPPWYGCPAGLFACGITSDGKVKGCLSMPDELIEGDLRQHDFWDIWFHPDSFAYNRRFSSVSLGSFCASCDKADQCRGGCITMSFASTGQFHNDPLCFSGIRTRTASTQRLAASQSK